MRPSQAGQDPRVNRILATLAADEDERLRPHLEEVNLRLGDVLYRPEEQLSSAYFPHSGTISVVALMGNGSEVEVGIIGHEGMWGLPIVMGTSTVPLQAVVQVPGGAHTLPVSVLAAEFSRAGQLQRLLLRYMQAFFIQAAITAACNRLHSLDERLARWLLMCQDRARADELPLTHEFMAVMLGVRRAGVSEAAKRLQEAGLIEYGRGHVRLLDRAGLQAASCECYGIIKGEFAQLTGQRLRARDAT